MQCPQCKSSNPPGSLYCVGCGLSQAQQRKLLEHAAKNNSSQNIAKVNLKKVATPVQNQKRSQN